MSAEEVAEAEAEAEAQRTFRESWAVATEARRSFLREHLTRRGKVAPGTLRTAVEIVYAFHSRREANPRMVADLLGVEGDEQTTLAEVAAPTTDARLPLLMLAFVAAQAEANFDQLDRAWSFSPELGGAVAAGCRSPRLPAYRSRRTDPDRLSASGRRASRRRCR